MPTRPDVRGQGWGYPPDWRNFCSLLNQVRPTLCTPASWVQWYLYWQSGSAGEEMAHKSGGSACSPCSHQFIQVNPSHITYNPHLTSTRTFSRPTLNLSMHSFDSCLQCPLSQWLNRTFPVVSTDWETENSFAQMAFQTVDLKCKQKRPDGLM